MSELKVNSIVDANSGNTAQINGMTPTADSLQGFRNRIINGGMVIDQRNNGASVSNTGATVFSVDRWKTLGTSASGVYSIQQDTNAPVGFSNSLKFTVTTTDTSLTGGDRYSVHQPIEGYNISDFAFGTAAATDVTVSFWVRSSVTGTFGGALQNGDSTRSYPFTYAISVADTWEYKTVTIPGDTSGTWGTGSDREGQLFWALGCGPDRSGTAGAWDSANYQTAAGATNLMATNGATFYITGVQLEAGSVATPFERRPFGTELNLCMRYYYKNFPALSNSGLGSSFNASTTQIVATGFFPVQMRARPTALEQTGTASDYRVAHRATSTACSSVPTYDSVTNQNLYTVVFTVSGGLTAGDGSQARTNSTSGFLAWSAEL